MINHFVPWHQVPIVAIDFETTGFSHSKDRPVQIGLARFEKDRPVKRFCSLINPGIPIPEKVVAIHGITDEKVKDAPTLDIAVQSAVIQGLFDGAVAVAFNAPFDRGFMKQLTNMYWQPPAFDDDFPWIDVLAISRKVENVPQGKGQHTLSAVCQRNGVELKSAHDAAHDAEAAGRCLLAFRKHLGNVTVSELLRQQHLALDDREPAFPSPQGWM